ncbi:formate dehydrogenase accessory sulfurtransferase FdhD [Enterovirga rhinocerotis]|nr:formate dehydrogenase accessory sulfurtransferase FdhD [Enterovirga rhinocerotis]
MIDVPVEMPVEIVFADIPFAVMMATPTHLDEFGLGFCLTEGVVQNAADVRGIETEEVEGGIRLRIDLAPDRLSQHLARRRAMSGRSGCGLCGIEDLAAIRRPELAVRAPPRVALPALRRALSSLEAGQSLNARTRAVHAAAWADVQGEVLVLREDVGRHNALDKLIGALLRDRIDPASGFIVITSRCSFEMVEKSAAFGAGMLVAVSAPTSLALDQAERLGMRLIAIARRDGVTTFVEGPPSARRDLVA